MPSNIKSKKTILIATIIIFTVIIAVLYFLEPTLRSDYKPENIINTQTTPTINIVNNIDTQIRNYTFDIPELTLPESIELYTFSLNAENIVTNTAKKLQMTQINSTSTTYSDTNNNMIKTGDNKRFIEIQNTNNPVLVGFSKDNILIKLSDLFNYSLTNYIFDMAAKSSNNQIIYYFNLHIDSYLVLSDFGSVSQLQVILDNGVLRHLNWEIASFSKGEQVKLINTQQIQQNFKGLQKGVYINYPTSNNSTAIESFPTVENFDGDIKITNIRLAYLWSENNTKIFPVYRLSCTFFYADGKQHTGYIVLNAI